MPGAAAASEPTVAVLGAALNGWRAGVPGLRPVVPVAAPVEELVRAAAVWPVRPDRDAGEEKHDAYAASAAALTKSGTSSLEWRSRACRCGSYRVNPITAAIVRRLVKVRYVSLVNLLAERERAGAVAAGVLSRRLRRAGAAADGAGGREGESARGSGRCWRDAAAPEG